MADGFLMCMANANQTSPYSQFEIIDISGSFARLDRGGVADDLSTSDTVYQGVFEKLITANIFYSFVDGNFAAVVVFAIFFGVSLGQVMLENGERNDGAGFTVAFFHEISKVLLKMINWIINCTPFAHCECAGISRRSQRGICKIGYLVAACLT